MKDRKTIQGCGTALVTPFTDDGAVDGSALENFVRFQIQEGVDFLVPCGSTGESAALSMDEHLEIVDRVVKTSGGKVPVVAGAGGNNTARVVDLSKAVAALGPDALLSVTPYYNKPTQEGLYRHFKAVAESVDLPVILYNVPGRTGVNLLPDTVVRLTEIPNIIGIKEASGNIDQISELAVKAPVGFRIISGDDANTIPIMSLGGTGLISVVSNEAPRWMSDLTRLCLEGKFDEAMRIQRKLFPLMRLNFIETSPIPVKAALAMMGKIRENYRLPLVPLKSENREKVRIELKALELVS
jgi:4-hydroxy-tetrahydrodipicolinate synthase